MPSPRGIAGDAAEREAIALLKREGYRVLLRNFRCRAGEIDIVAEEGEVLCFVEVRSRSAERHGDPLETIGRAKQKRIFRAAQNFLALRGLQDRLIRFDVVGITLPPGSRIRLVRGAFEPDSPL